MSPQSVRSAGASLRTLRSPLTSTLMCALLLALAGCGKGNQAPQAGSAPEVTVQPVVVQDVPIVPEFVGQTESSRQVEIRARVSGFLEKRLYREGAMVKEGQPLFQLDRKPFEAQLQVAKAQLAQEEARLVTAEANRKRIEPLAEKNAVSQKDRDDAIGNYRAAAAGVEAAKAAVITAELNLSYTGIHSPVSGLASFAKVAEGTYLDPQNSLLTYVAALSPMRVNFSISENQQLSFGDMVKKGVVRAPKEGDFRVEVVLADGSRFEETGRLTFTDASFSQETGTFLARAELPNTKGTLRPGQFVRVRLHGAYRLNGIVVPQRAVLQTAQGNLAFVVDAAGKAQVRPLQLASMQGDNWVVSAGLKAGDNLVVDGGMKLRPDVPVKVVKTLEPFKADVDPVLMPQTEQSAAAAK
ncbi:MULTISPECIES: efflux RND transporter periplasmic adaptor subunit [Niveibacterium]|uniref:Efflux RND transporter periplasmic adaptor subunit n=1 Tax=Niveibacterium microcysteis TaxID=2811415 RepID=A0ABX7M9I2_9RHOO|nr:MULTISPECIES: efflux RND transporter periplasmic adaptor subunit [Niveibacterium]QSI78281.1 efflux RND transporter periplasmic adaptor subunit [Niveibacterium microcysteis]